MKRATFDLGLKLSLGRTKYFRFFAAATGQRRTIACRTRELSAELTVTRDHWRKQNPPVCMRQNFERFLARVTKNSQNFAAHGKNLLTPMGTSDC